VILKFYARLNYQRAALFLLGVPSELSGPVMRKNSYVRWHTSPVISKHRIRLLKLPRAGLSFCAQASRLNILLAVAIGTSRQSVPEWLTVAFGAKRTLFGTGAECLGRE
jgi:hypothetical protein